MLESVDTQATTPASPAEPDARCSTQHHVPDVCMSADICHVLLSQWRHVFHYQNRRVHSLQLRVSSHSLRSSAFLLVAVLAVSQMSMFAYVISILSIHSDSQYVIPSTYVTSRPLLRLHLSAYKRRMQQWERCLFPLRSGYFYRLKRFYLHLDNVRIPEIFLFHDKEKEKEKLT